MSADEFREQPPTDQWPPDFAEWSLSLQQRQVTMRMTRRGLIAACLSHAGLAVDEFDVADDRKLTKEELAAIYLTLEGFNDGRD